MVDYDLIIEKYMDKGTPVYEIYYTHVSLVTEYALDIAHNLKLEKSQLRFIEEAGMLHDIGIVEVDHPGIECCGKLPYIQHLIAGREILEDREGLPEHAMVAMRHCSPNLTKEYVREYQVRLPIDDYTPQTLEEKIIAFSDLHFTKSKCEKALRNKKTFEDVLLEVETYHPDTPRAVLRWAEELEVL